MLKTDMYSSRGAGAVAVLGQFGIALVPPNQLAGAQAAVNGMTSIPNWLRQMAGENADIAFYDASGPNTFLTLLGNAEVEFQRPGEPMQAAQTRLWGQLVNSLEFERIILRLPGNSLGSWTPLNAGVVDANEVCIGMLPVAPAPASAPAESLVSPFAPPSGNISPVADAAPAVDVAAADKEDSASPFAPKTSTPPPSPWAPAQPKEPEPSSLSSMIFGGPQRQDSPPPWSPGGSEAVRAPAPQQPESPFAPPAPPMPEAVFSPPTPSQPESPFAPPTPPVPPAGMPSVPPPPPFGQPAPVFGKPAPTFGEPASAPEVTPTPPTMPETPSPFWAPTPSEAELDAELAEMEATAFAPPMLDDDDEDDIEATVLRRHGTSAPRQKTAFLVYAGSAPVEVTGDVVIGRQPNVQALSGRAEAQKLRVPSPASEISRSHCAVLTTAPGSWALTDLGSVNGTILRKADGFVEEIGPTVTLALSDGDVIDLGEGVSIEFRVR